MITGSQSSSNKLIKKLLCGCKIIDEFILQLYHSMTNSFDTIILDVDIHPFLKKILHSKQIFFYLFFTTNFLLLGNNINIELIIENLEFLVYIKKSLFYIFLILNFLLILLIFILKLRSLEGMYLKRYEELENYILTNFKELKANQCTDCNLTKCLRSFHCNICCKCVTRYEMHSDWFNMCIGSLNYIPYLAIVLVINLYLLIILINLFFQIFYLGTSSPIYDLGNKEFIFHFWLIIVIYLTVKHFNFTRDFVKMGIAKSLTDYEGYTWRRLPYLWKNMRKEFFNPFDKGVKRNLKEMWLCFINPSLDKMNYSANDKNEFTFFSNGTQILTIDEEKSNIQDAEKNENSHGLGGDQPSQNSSLSVTPSLDSLVTHDGQVIYRPYNGNLQDLINWNRIRIYSILDIKNSPFREIVLKQLVASTQIKN